MGVSDSGTTPNQEAAAVPAPEAATAAKQPETGGNLAERTAEGGPYTLAVDIGGTGIKVEVLNAGGEPVTERAKLPTPHPATPDSVIAIIEELAKSQGAFDRISAGFPGVVKKGITFTAFNLGPEFEGFNLAQTLREKLKRPARVANDADIQGLGAIRGRGLEMVITLGTGFGSALFIDGHLVPNVQLGHHPARKKDTYEDLLGRAALEKAGKKKWNRRLEKAIAELTATFNFDRLYIGGGNAKFIHIQLPANVKVVSNDAGLLGGIALWRDPELVMPKAAGKKTIRSRPASILRED
ncbi:MAG TPA: ROK family protein [Candidatus Binataceae bacterium]|jgi:polyphosphate glucokinase